MGVYDFDAQALEEVLTADAYASGSRHDFGGDIIPQMIEDYRVYAFPHLGYWVDVGAIETYWQAHMDLLENEPPLSLFDREWVIHTRSQERPPANFRNGATIRDSLIADGCVIEGVVEHSVLSSGVVLRPGAIVRRSIVMADTVIGKNAIVDHAILDKHVQVGAGSRVGWENERTDNIAAGLHTGLTVVGKNTHIPAGMRIGRNCVVAADLDEDAFEENRILSGTNVGLNLQNPSWLDRRGNDYDHLRGVSPIIIANPAIRSSKSRSENTLLSDPIPIL
jgi:glucose-1-phosphate adenylyltransferase